MELKTFLKLMKAKLGFIIAFVLVATAAVASYSVYFMKPEYEATATLILVRSNELTGGKAVDYNTLMANGMLLASYRDIASSTKVMKRVVSTYPQLQMTVAELKAAIGVSTANNEMMAVTAHSGSYEKAMQIANAVSEAIVGEIPKITKLDNVELLDEAPPLSDPAPVKPSVKINAMIAFIVSSLLAVAIVLVREYLDDTVRTEEQVERQLGLPVLTIIPKLKKEQLYPHSKTAAGERSGERAYVAVNS